MNSTDKTNTDEKLKEETQTDLEHNILLLSETSENGREALTSPDWSYADRRFFITKFIPKKYDSGDIAGRNI